jgi:ABC-type phosphate transport system permease subunit
MGETMAVMMVMGNAIGVPQLLGKGETISALIAMEMGIAVVGSTHYSALYTAGFVLMILLFAINLGFEALKRKLKGGGYV